MKNRNDDILLYVAMADAYAAGAEYIRLPEHQKRLDECLEFTAYRQNPKHLDLKPGMYTDDTEMSIAVAHTLTRRSGAATQLDFAEDFMAEFWRHGIRQGYARGFQKFLESVGSGRELLDNIRPGSRKNGAAMRAMPLGALPSAFTVMAVSDIQASVTHDTTEGLFSSRMVGLMSHYALWETGPLSWLGEYLSDLLPSGDIRRFGHVLCERWSGGPVVSTDEWPVSVTTVHAVFDLVTREGSLMDILRRTIEWGGDTDSVAAIAWGIASSRMAEEELPEFLERDLEAGRPTGPEYLREIGRNLMGRFEP